MRNEIIIFSIKHTPCFSDWVIWIFIFVSIFNVIQIIICSLDYTSFKNNVFLAVGDACIMHKWRESRWGVNGPELRVVSCQISNLLMKTFWNDLLLQNLEYQQPLDCLAGHWEFILEWVTWTKGNVLLENMIGS